MYVCIHSFLFAYLFICLFIYLLNYLFVCLFICLLILSFILLFLSVVCVCREGGGAHSIFKSYKPHNVKIINLVCVNNAAQPI